MKKAFTLIELLVVIAIIAILAAILFPVFAQAKLAAKKTVALSNVKQLGTCMVMYASDSDDSLPSAYSVQANGHPWYRYPASYPAGWTTNSDYVESEDALQWSNSSQPYSKSYDLTEIPGQKVTPAGADFPKRAGRQPKMGGISMNGFMSLYPMTAVAAPSSTILLWTDDNENWEGFTWANPWLNCTGRAVCRYAGSTSCAQSDQSSCSNGSGYISNIFNASPWLFGRHGVVVYSDGSAKSRYYGQRVGLSAAAQSPVHRTDPWRRYDAKGIGYSAYWCGPLSIECLFMPDRDPNQ